jgi:hypothetical protein
VQFGGVTATVLSATSTSLVVQLPAGFSSGLVSVTVNGVTATSGTLLFTPPPSITSITPAYGDISQTVTGVIVQGTNLSGATFTLPGGGTVSPVSVNNTQATVNITLGSTMGAYALVATAPSGASSGTAFTAGNTFIVYNSPGNNISDMLFSVFNVIGPTPHYPAGSNELDEAISVFNALSPPGASQFIPPGANEVDSTFSLFNPQATSGVPQLIPPGSNEADQVFSLMNGSVTPGTVTYIPAGSNEIDGSFSLLNTAIVPGTTPLVPPGFNETWQLFSTSNSQSGGASASVAISVSQAARPTSPIGEPVETGGSHLPLNLIAGESVQIALRPSRFMGYLEIDAGQTALATSTTGSLSLPLTAPFGVDQFTLKGFGFTTSGAEVDSLLETIRVSQDPGRTISGQVVDADGSPVAGAVVTWQAQGLAAEYYRFGSELREVPELRGPGVRQGFLGALNYPNPKQVFGLDPMGSGAGPNFAARYSGTIQIDTAGLYQFALLAHRGARLTIDGQVIADALAAGPDAVTAVGSVTLMAGSHAIDIVHFESAGAAALQLLWTPPDSTQAVVPPRAVVAEAPAGWRTVTGNDGRFALQVPASLDGVTVKLAAGAGSIQLDR